MSVELVATVGAVFLTVALLAGLGAARVLDSFAPERRRLRDLTRPKEPALVLAPETGPLVVETAPAWQRLSRFVPKSPREMSRLRRRLASAGWLHPGAAVAVALIEVILPVILGVTVLLLVGRDLRGWGLAAAAAIIGYLLPSFGVEYFVNKRRKQIRNGLPDVLDLLIVCLEAGSSLDQAITKATEDLEIAYPALTDELRVLATETRAGKPRLEAFNNLAQRTRVDDVRALVAMLVQTDRFGTSVSQALRTLAQTMRTKRRQRAEEAAAKVGVKLVFPLVFFLFPAFYVVTLGPAVIQFVRVFASIGR